MKTFTATDIENLPTFPNNFSHSQSEIEFSVINSPNLYKYNSSNYLSKNNLNIEQSLLVQNPSSQIDSNQNFQKSFKSMALFSSAINESQSSSTNQQNTNNANKQSIKNISFSDFKQSSSSDKVLSYFDKESKNKDHFSEDRFTKNNTNEKNSINNIASEKIFKNSTSFEAGKILDSFFPPRIIGNRFNTNNQIDESTENNFNKSLQYPSTSYNSSFSLNSNKNSEKLIEKEPFLKSEDLVPPKLLHQTTVLSFWVNLCLLGAKIYISFISGSMSIIACTIDSLMDVISGILILLTQRIILQKRFVEFDQKYPAGRSLLEPVCTIVYATTMASVSVQLCVFCIQQSFFPNPIPPSIDVSILFVLFFTVLIKLILWAFCILISKQRGDYIFVLTNDNKSDVITNSIAFILSLIIFFNKELRFLDNLGAFFIAGFASFTWIYSNKDQIHILSAYKADPKFYSYIATIISEFQQIYVDDIKAYHFGVKYMVELYIVMDPLTTVREYVKIEKQLKKAIKSLSMVQQCFISIDYQRRFVPVNEQVETRLQRRRPKGGDIRK